MNKAKNYKIEIIFSGFGGQGILFAGNLFALAGVLAGYHATFLPVYGPEMRGGTCNCTTIISQTEIASPVVKEPDVLVLLNLPSYLKFMPRLKKKGLAILNLDLIPEEVILKDDKLYQGKRLLKIPMNSLSENIGYPQLANMVAVGALWATLKPFDKKYIEEALKEMLKGGKERFLAPNLQAFNSGIEFVVKEKTK
jgi:2-oxoglutarate ferredoxin oxidoreductase subunit gamma